MRVDIQTKKQILARLGKSLLFRLLIVGMVLYALYHVVTATSSRLVTDVVVSGEERTTLVGEAVIFRDETVLTAVGGRYLCSYPLVSGAKVNANTTLAQLYTTSLEEDELAQAQATLTALDRQIELAERVPDHDALASLAELRAQVREQLIANAQNATGGAPMNEISGGAFDLLLTLNRIDALTGQTTGSEAVLTALQGERSRLLLAAGYAGRTLSVSDVPGEQTSGYFYHAERVDGYEDILTRSALFAMTLNELEAALASERVTYGQGVSVVGKLAASHRWSIAVAVDPLLARDMQAGDRFAVLFTDEYGVTLSMTLDRVIGSVADGRAYAVLSTNELPDGFGFTRFSRVEITLSTQKGYRLPETALHTLDGKDGVYILEGGRVSWRDVEIVARGEGFVLAYAPTREQRESEQDDTYHADRYIALQDVVIVEGKQLYDGKYIN